MNTKTDLTLISNETLETTKSASLSYQDISTSLHTTLECDKLIAMFSQKISKMVPHSAYAYINYEIDQSILSGVFTRHSCNYALQFKKQSLGELRLMRNYRFEPVELQLLEVLLSCLIYPLKNTIMHYKMAEVQSVKTIFRVDEKRLTPDFGVAYNNGVNALVEHNRRKYEKKTTASYPQDSKEYDPWAVGFFR